MSATNPASKASSKLDRLLAQTRGCVPSPAIAADLADAAITTRRESEAVPAVRAAAASQGANAALWQWLGLLCRGADRQEEAIRAFQKAAQLEPRNIRAMHGLALSAMDAGLPASPLFERAARLAPENGDVALGWAAARVAEGRPDLALAGLDARLVDNPGWLMGHEHAAHIRWMSGERNTFTSTLVDAMSREPRMAALWHTAQVLLIQAGAFERALEVGEQGRRAAGADRRFDENEALLSSELGLNERADALFARLGSEGDIGFAVHHVRHQLRTNRPGAALREAERWLGRPNARLIWPYVGLAWRIMKDPRGEWLDDERLVRVYDIADELPPLEVLATHLRKLQVSPSPQLDQSVRGGTQTIGPLFSRIEPEIRQLRATIVRAVQDYIRRLPASDPTHPTLGATRAREVRFSGSWSVRLTGGGYHANHVHSAGWLSSALYVVLPNAARRGGDHAGWLALGEPPRELGIDLPPLRLIEPRPGRLVLFPSITWHGTRPFAADERLTVAADVALPFDAATDGGA